MWRIAEKCCGSKPLEAVVVVFMVQGLQSIRSREEKCIEIANRRPWDDGKSISARIGIHTSHAILLALALMLPNAGL